MAYVFANWDVASCRGFVEASTTVRAWDQTNHETGARVRVRVRVTV